MKYLIHSCNSRQWYVDEYLIPSLLTQGIDEKDIKVYQDIHREGNLVSFVKSCQTPFIITNLEEDTWHLQDDVIISSTFKEETSRLNNPPIICGFACKYDNQLPPGMTKVTEGMWWSFPCIKIPNKIAYEFSRWADETIWTHPDYRLWVKAKKYDDLIFKIFIEDYYTNIDILNLAPNLVDHIDYLIGGTQVNKQRGATAVRSIYWNELGAVKELERKILLNSVVN